MRSAPFSFFVISIALQSLLGPLASFSVLHLAVGLRLIMSSMPSRGSIALKKTASGFPGVAPDITLKQWYMP